VKYLLDTNALSEPIRRRPSPVFMERLTRLQAHLCTSVLCVGEMMYGARRRPQGARYEAYLREVVLVQMPILGVDLTIATIYGELRAQLERAGRARSDMDLLIAATALANDLTVVTRNLDDFEGTAELRVEDWTAR